MEWSSVLLYFFYIVIENGWKVKTNVENAGDRKTPTQGFL